MPTFLVTSKMDPALAARVEASVRGRRARDRGRIVRRRSSRRLISSARFALAFAVVASVIAAVRFRVRERREVEGARASLLAAWHARASWASPYDLTYPARTAARIGAIASQPADRDVVGSELRATGAFSALLARPLVYVRGPLATLATPATTTSTLGATAEASTKDAFLVCLLDPPASRTEKAILGKLRLAGGSASDVEARTPHARRLRDALVALPLLSPAWEARVREADDVDALEKLRRDFERAPVDAAKEAIQASLLFVVMEERAEGGPVELDGERPRWIRVVLTDVDAGTTLLRLRRFVDPAWISLAKRSEAASAFDGCGLAFDVHEAIRSR